MLEAETKYYVSESMFHGFIPHIMGTRFDILVIHPDTDRINRIWLTLTDELERLDKMLNRFDAHSEIARINSRLSTTPICISEELEEILCLCRYYYEKTFHLFDITLKDFSCLQHADKLNIYSTTSPLSLDLGGFAKGYALKKIRHLLLQEDIEHAFIDFGNSSILGMGHHPYGDCWKVSLLNPYTQMPLGEFKLRNEALSTSGNTFRYSGHIINPTTGVYNGQRQTATIVATDPLDAEVLSTVWMIASETEQKEISKNFDNVKGTLYML